LVVACAEVKPTPPVPTPLPTISKPTAIKVFRIALAIFPEVFDPAKSASSNDIQPLKLCYEGLTALDSSSNIGPGAADRYQVSTDGASMTFHIRENLRRADGVPMNASDFEYALKRAVDPRLTDKQYTDIVHEIKGADDLIDTEGKKLSDDDLNKLYGKFGVQAKDDLRELTVTFARPTGFWQYIAATTITFSPEKKRVDAAPNSWWSKVDGHNCYGPFKFQTIEQGKRIVFQANPNYWRGKPKIDRIEVVYLADEVQRLEAYKLGELDEIAVTSSTLDSVTTDSRLSGDLLRYPAALTVAIGFNNARKPFDDKNVRIAFSQAIDREGWIRDVQKGIGKAYTRWIPPGVIGAQADKPGVPGYNPLLAVDMLIRGGYGTADGKKVDCNKLGELKLTFSNSALNTQRFQFLAGNLKRVFDCPVTLDPVEPTVYATLTRDPKTNPKITRQGWIEDYPYPQNWLSFYWKCDGYARRYSYCNKDLDLSLTKADSTASSDDSIRLYQQAEDLLLADVPGAPISYSENLYLLKGYVKGPKDNLSSFDYGWAGEWGPLSTYDIDLTHVPDNYPSN
jgi:oligopeptide transport system substrate-binding protein